MSVRLNKLLAQRGLGARRKCDLLIQEGRVRVNGKIVREPGTRVEPERDRIEVAGQPIPPPAPKRYYALNKPVGVITTLEDPEGRRTLREFLPPGSRLFPVGRLDADTSGLLLVTNDGELAHRLMHPRYGVEKVYRAWLDHPPSEDQIARLRAGVEFEPGIVSEPARVRALKGDGTRGLIEIAIHEGRHRQVRRMCEAVGLGVVGLHRAYYGPVGLGPLARGMWRELSSEEVARLRAASARPRPRARRPGEFFSARRGLVRTGRPRRIDRPRTARSDRLSELAGTTGPRPLERRPRSARGPEGARPSPRRAFERSPQPAREPRERRPPRRGEQRPRRARGAEETRPWPRSSGARRARSAREREAGRPRDGRPAGPPARGRPAGGRRWRAARQPGAIGSGPGRSVGGGEGARRRKAAASARSARRRRGSQPFPAFPSRGKSRTGAPSRSRAERGRRPPRDRRG